MFIKYKGIIGNVLADLSIELKQPLNLKVSEDVLTAFFQNVLKQISFEKMLTLTIQLPAWIKPFCTAKKSTLHKDTLAQLFSTHQQIQTQQSILKVLEKYIPAKDLAVIYNCFPESVFENINVRKKELLIR